MHWPGIDNTVFAALGQTIVASELRGNFASAGACASRSIAPEAPFTEIFSPADAELQVAIVRLMGGDSGAALPHLLRAKELSAGKPHTALRVLAWLRAHKQLSFNTFPGQISCNSIEVENRCSFVEHEKYYGRRWQELFPQCSRAYAISEAAWVYSVLSSVSMNRGLAARLRGEAKQQHLVAILATAEKFAKDNFFLRFRPRLWAALNVHVADVLFLAREYGAAFQWLAQARQIYGQLKDTAGEALTWLQEGDWCFDPSGPAATWGVVINEQHTDRNVEHAERDGASPAPQPEYGRAWASWAEAESRFADCDAPRAVAALQLRKCWKALVDRDIERALELVGAAERSFAETHDSSNRWASAANRILLDVLAHARTEDHDSAAQIGAWGAHQGSFSMALGFGIWFGQTGASLQAGGDYERALSCHRLAQTTFQALGAPLNESQSLCDQGHVTALAGDRDDAVVRLEQAISLLRQIRGRHRRPHLTAATETRLSDIAGQLLNLYIPKMDAKAIGEFATRASTDAQTMESETAGAPYSGPHVYAAISASVREGRELTSAEHNALVLAERQQAERRMREAADVAEVLATCYKACIIARKGAPNWPRRFSIKRSQTPTA